MPKKQSAAKLVLIILGIALLVLSLGIGTCLYSVGLMSKVSGTIITNLPRVRNVQGHVTSAGGRLGKFTATLQSCRSGKSSGFLGVDLFSAEGQSQTHLRFVKDAIRGNVVMVAPPGSDQAVVFDQKKCKVIQGTIRQHGYAGGRSATRWACDGHLRFDCSYEDKQGKGHVEGEVNFKQCF